jgi:CubicO group peptidase (beta-lactamase class C family)
MLARDRGLLDDLDAPLSAYGWEGPADTVSLTARGLLSHRSGLPPWRPLYLLGGKGPEERAALAREAILRERPLFPEGAATLYSDLGFVLLGLLLEGLFRAPLGRLFSELVAGPLGLGAARFGPIACGDAPGGARVAPTEDGFRCGGPLGYPGVPILGPVPPGRAHDDNAAWLGGAAGHAGLFSTASDALALTAEWQRGFAGLGGLFSRDTAREFMALQGPEGQAGRRALGFDALERPGGGGLAIGHKGYTGTALWFDPEGGAALALLCNRVHPTSRRGGADALRDGLARMAFRS